ncbi:MAG: multidrug efflux SMR transporter [Bacteroidales bacterium]|nr:multidrug efflux SMR transporter [Bacteroidales bacterium]
MQYLYLFIAALFEVGWPLGFKLADLHAERFWTFIGLGALSMALSGIFLYLAQRTMPISTAYIIWTGIGAIGTFLIGIFCFGDSASVLRMLFALLILVGIIGIELTGKN